MSTLLEQVPPLILAAIGVSGLYLTTWKLWQGYAVGVVAQVLWIIFAIVTEQYGFLLSAPFYAWVNLVGVRRWRAERRTAAAASEE
ncbi:PnuC-like nicotinamide riboside transporter [Gordonia phage Morgana]|uniref:PnuC-like nicotinamide riboside transporter n=1 Tax=Gordonia phage Morgana TaxID=3137292 RepID=A0AAX4RAN7_9CAUD